MSFLFRTLIILLGFSFQSWAATVTFQLKDNSGKPLPEAIITLEPLSQGAINLAQKMSPPNAVMTQNNKQFSPHVVAVQKGKAVSFPNQDNIKHQVYSLSDIQQFDLTVEAGETRSGPLMAESGAIHIGCNIHDWMQAYVYVTNTPWFAKSDSNGMVMLEVPDNEQFHWNMWHARLSQQEPPHYGQLLSPAEQIHIQLQTELLPNYDEANDFDDFDDY